MSLLIRLLALLALFFRPAAEGDPEDPPADPQDPPADPDPQPELDLETPEEDPPARVEPSEELEAARREAKEARERAERAEREAAEYRTRQAPAPSDEVAREDARLADPAVPEMEKWTIRANRELRANRTASQIALAQAEDVRDQSAFSQLALTEPALHKRYAAKVEQELANARRQGFNPRREVIYNQLIAKDMREGKFKKKAPLAPKADTVNRGKPPGARSDVNARPSLSRRDQLAKKLENVQI